jgi:hypothetical protein
MLLAIRVVVPARNPLLPRPDVPRAPLAPPTTTPQTGWSTMGGKQLASASGSGWGWQAAFGSPAARDADAAAEGKPAPPPDPGLKLCSTLHTLLVREGALPPSAMCQLRPCARLLRSLLTEAATKAGALGLELHAIRRKFDTQHPGVSSRATPLCRPEQCGRPAGGGDVLEELFDALLGPDAPPPPPPPTAPVQAPYAAGADGITASFSPGCARESFG